MNNSPAYIAGIVIALPEEVATLTSTRLKQGDCISLQENALLIYAGAGPKNATSAAKTLIGKGANRLISWGCAAAVAADLRSGDLMLPTRVIGNGQSFSIDLDWLQQTRQLLKSNVNCIDGDLVSSDRIIASVEEKQSIHQQSAALALDMESAAIVEVAAHAGVPSLVIRAIADTADMSLPQAVVHSLNSNGQIELGKLSRYLVTHPGEIPALIRLGLHFAAAQKTLKTVASQLKQIIDN